MVEFVDAGRSEKTPMSIHRKPLISYPCLSPLSQSAISCANNQKLGFVKWDEAKGGWIAYTIHLPQGWRSSVTVVDDRLIVPSKPGKGSKREAPVDQTIEKAPKEAAPSPKKTSVKKTKAGKKGKSTVAPPKAKSVDASVSTKKPSKKSIASRPPKGQKKASVSSSSPDEEPPSAALTPPPSKKKKFTAPLFPFAAASRTRSKSSSKVNFFFFCFTPLSFAIFSHSFVCGRQHMDLVNLVVVWLLLRLPWHTSSSFLWYFL